MINCETFVLAGVWDGGDHLPQVLDTSCFLGHFQKPGYGTGTGS